MNKLSKMVFLESRKFLQPDDPMRQDTEAFPKKSAQTKPVEPRRNHKRGGEAILKIEKELKGCKIKKRQT